MRNLIIKGLSKLRFLKKLNLSFNKSINGKRFRIPILKGNGQQNFAGAEKWMDDVLKRLLSAKQGGFIDIGVNVGQTLLKVKSIQKDIPYYGFEPNPICILYVNELIEKNKIEKTSLFPVGISEKTGIAELNFYYDSDTDSSASIIKDFRPTQQVRKKVYIPCYTIDEFRDFIDFSSVSIIKVDVEGAELEVLKGLSKFLEKARPFIVMEILPVYKRENTGRLQRQAEIEKILQGHRYKIFRIHKTAGDNLSHFEPLTEIGIHSEMNWCDYVFCPEELSF